MEARPGLGFGGSRQQLVALYPPLGDLLARAEAKLSLVWQGEAGFLAEAAREALSGRGKRLRPILLLLSAECAGGATDHSTALAAVVEVVHAASIVHDDVIDDASSRRGQLSARQAWGTKISVLLGDYLIARSLSLLDGRETSRLLSHLSSVTSRMCQGQVAELRAAGRRMTEDQYLGIVSAKTASLFGFCCRVGAETAGGPPEVSDGLALFGESFGVAFQVTDDILDLIGSDGRSGKPEGRDMAERKWTLPLICAYERGERDARGRLRQLLEADQVSAREVREARQIALGTGAIAYCWQRADDWLRQARTHLARLPDSPARKALLAIAGERFPMPVMT
jgi:octaprenyl-diphosphate synthase